MRRVLCLIISVLLVMTSSVVFGANDNGNNKSNDKKVSSRISNYLKEQQKISENNKNKAKELANMISINDNVTGLLANQFDYSANWSYSQLVGAYSSDIHSSVSENAYAQIKFTGMKIKIYGSTGPGDGIAAISIDGKREMFVNYYSSTNKNGTLIYTSPVLANAEHMLKIRVTALKGRSSSNYNINIDRVGIISKGPVVVVPSPTIAVTPTATPTPVPALSKVIVNDNTFGIGNNQFEYIGSWYYSNNNRANFSDYHWTNTTDAACQIRFLGKQIKLYGIKDSNSGIIAVSIDGAIETNIDCFSARRNESGVIYTSPILANGQHILRFRVTGTKNIKATNTCLIVDKAEIKYESSNLNLALNKLAVASSSNDISRGPEKAFDGNANTNWYSQYTDTEWIYVDLGSVQNIGRVKLKWETAYGRMYRIQVSNDAVVWTDVYTTATGNGGTEDILINSVNARYVKLSGLGRATQWGYSLREFEVYNS